MSKENNFKNWLTKVLRDRGAMVQPIETSVGSGVPDLAVLWNEKTYWIEVKSLSGAVWIRSSQQIWHREAWVKGRTTVRIINENPKTGKIKVYLADWRNNKNSKGFLTLDTRLCYETRADFVARSNFIH